MSDGTYFTPAKVMMWFGVIAGLILFYVYVVGNGELISEGEEPVYYYGE